MAMISINDYSMQPAQVTLIGPVIDDIGGVTASVQFLLSGGHMVHFRGTHGECATKRAEVVTAINALDAPVEP
jgi:hypothetical protein